MIFKVIRTLIREEDGASATEYSIMLVLILVVAMATIAYLGGRVDEAFNTFATMFADAFP